MVITAVKKKDQWFVDHEHPFWIPGFRIRPGYIIMADASRLKPYKGTTMHSKLFHYVFRRSLEQLQNEGVEVLGLGFSYQSKDSKTKEWFCDFKFKSTTFNAGKFLSFFPKEALRKGSDGTVRSIDAWSENLSRIAIQNWIDKSHENGYTFRNRITTVQEILNAENYWYYTWNDCQLPPKKASETCSPKYRELNQEAKEKLKIFAQSQKPSEIMTESCFDPAKVVPPTPPC